METVRLDRSGEDLAVEMRELELELSLVLLGPELSMMDGSKVFRRCCCVKGRE